ncbi:gamma carbonic anhydrase family protein [Thiofilum flexile]|uniref:gamma carbonic anhydrase family protein n=1 Tax=Thiofilum flexile TaxID=125627 RepID=UPI0003813613|nr:gamma carbonic anhydrase family protein [Thiofilum flexile]
MTIQRFEQHTPTIDPSAYIDKSAYVSGQTTIGADSSVWPMVVIRGDINIITIGARTNVQDGSILHVTHGSAFSRMEGFALTIGDEVTIGHRVILHGCTIGNRCLIGMGAIVMDNVVIEDEVMIGAGSLVPPGKTLEGGYLWKGNPVQKARPLTEQERAFLKYSAEHYSKLAKRTLASE